MVVRSQGLVMKEFKYKDGWKIVTEEKPPYGIMAKVFNPKGKMVTRRTFPPGTCDDEEHHVAELMYVQHAFADWKKT